MFIHRIKYISKALKKESVHFWKAPNITIRKEWTTTQHFLSVQEFLDAPTGSVRTCLTGCALHYQFYNKWTRKGCLCSISSVLLTSHEKLVQSPLSGAHSGGSILLIQFPVFWPKTKWISRCKRFNYWRNYAYKNCCISNWANWSQRNGFVVTKMWIVNHVWAV